ncbi:MAG TPA: CBS domain-containing protein [Longimicrobium sp.]|nr:CBS domain-containing protein [Longimicrobium sp.]
MRACDLMTCHPRAVTLGDPLSRAAEIMRDDDVGMVPVVEDMLSMRLKGVITDRDIVVRCVAPRHGAFCNVGAHLTREPLVAVLPEADVDEVMALMKENQVRRVLVTEHGRLRGVIALADLVRLAGPLEPLQLEAVLEGVSAPSHALAAA